MVSMELLGKSNEMKGGGVWFWGELAMNQHCIQGDVTEIWMNLLTLILPLMNVRRLFFAQDEQHETEERLCFVFPS